MTASGRLWRDWVAACVAGEALGIGVAAAAVGVVLAVGEPASPGERWSVFALLVGAGAVEGLALGGMQWRVLRRTVPAVRARAWVGATVAVAVLGWAVGMLPSTLWPQSPAPESAFDPGLVTIVVAAALGGAGAGVVFGGAQWLVLRPHVADAGRWIGANALGWALAMAWIFVAASLLPEGTPVGVVAAVGVGAGLLSGVSVGAVTGAALVRLTGPLP